MDHIFEALESAVGNNEVDLVGISEDIKRRGRSHGFALKANNINVSESRDSIFDQVIQVLRLKAAHGADGLLIGAVAAKVVDNAGKT